ncbi:MAG: hypothetical protein U9R27_09655 [Campylobacterota bacterium]|nr:hypothetical protein [Campylobacterota bacterium]
MKIDLMSILYNTSMIVLILVVSFVATKKLGKHFSDEEESEK